MPSSKTMQRLRRITQALFLAVFFWLLLATFYHGVAEEGGALRDELPYPVSLFLQIDPLAALTTFLSTGTLFKDLLPALAVLALTLFLGRCFCGWVCPFGTLHNLFTRIPKKPNRAWAEHNKPGKHQRIKYVLLLFLIGSALAGTLFVGLLDPLSFLIRSLGLSVLPALDRVARSGLDALPSVFSGTAEGIHRFLDHYFLGPSAHRFYGGWLLGALFIAIVALNWVIPRFWCRALCPLGALLGLCSRFTSIGIHRKEEACKECSLCERVCQGAASPGTTGPWKPSECFVCFNCLAACPKGALEMKAGIQTATTEPRVDLRRRTFVTSFALGAAALPLARAARDPARDQDPALLRPPGACAEEEFLARCIKCGQCMKVCPNNALHPAVAQGGIEGFWSPVLIARIGYCEPTCTLCGQVCPTGAIRAFTEADKKENRVKVGTALFDRSRCIPHVLSTDCMVCEEFCPTSPKAIWFEPREMAVRGGGKKTVNLPMVDPALCTGCGVCEHICPVADQAAIRVTSVGESRSKTNRILVGDPARRRAASSAPMQGAAPAEPVRPAGDAPAPPAEGRNEGRGP